MGGQAAVEFALIFPAFLFVVTAVIAATIIVVKGEYLSTAAFLKSREERLKMEFYERTSFDGMCESDTLPSVAAEGCAQ
jgi:Flp pilus assembly protein TadG